MRYLSEAIDNLDLVNAVYAWTQPPMHAEDFVVDHHAQREEIKHVGEVMPDIGIAVLAITFCIETVRLGDTARFVITSDEMNPLWVPQLEADEKGDCLDGEKATIYVVAYETVSSLIKYSAHISS